ncbi:MAG: UvrD-helicase domain-containing protein [Ignavibacteriae bacterium]|nr:UvrD-helicase domain-containing protein [Ignavibacteriota bacterium]
MKLQLVKQQADELPEFLKGLNPEQLKAAATTEGPLLIIAGAGSGKTRVVTFRIAYLLDKGIAPYNILALTFTNKAAHEMKERIATMVGDSTSSKVWAGTFHSIFARILRSEAEHLGYTPSFSIYDSDDSLSIVRAVMNTLGVSQQQVPPQGVRSRISSAKNQMIGWQRYAAEAGNILEKQTGQIYEEYEKRLRLNNAMDFDDLLINIINVFRNFPEILKKYQDRFRYIHVDEYQDTNRAQYMAIKMLAAGQHGNLCVVGDDAQSIYKWRGADIRNILDFQNDYPNAAVVRLEQNYRSTKTILSAADDVIGNNRKQLAKKLWTDNPQGAKIGILPARDDREEADMILKTLKTEMNENFLAPKDFAILYRTNAQSQALEDSLRRAAVPYTIVGGVSFYKRKEVKDTVAYLRLLVNPNDSESLLRVINEPPRGIGATSIQHIRTFADERNISLFEAFAHANEITTIQKRAAVAAQTFTQMVQKFIDIKTDIPPTELAVSFMEATGLLRMLKDENTEESLDRWNNVQRLLSNIAEMTAREENPSLEAFLQQIALVSDTDEADTTKNRVALMTMHAAKGLEFPVVFIAGMEQGLFPMGRAENNAEETEEERRLFYVGITRARQKLYLSHAERRFRFGELVFSQPSRFVGEIRQELLEVKVGTMSFQQRQAPPKQQVEVKSVRQPFFDDIPKDDFISQVPPKQQKLRVGIKVKHAQFGVGTVQGLSGEGLKAQAVVYFPTFGKKHLMLEYAKLQVVG